MPTIALMIGGMNCRHCVREVTSRLRDVPGVDTVTADAGRSVVQLAGTMRVDDVLGALNELSYPVQLLDEPGDAADTLSHTPATVGQREDSRSREGS